MKLAVDHPVALLLASHYYYSPHLNPIKEIAEAELEEGRKGGNCELEYESCHIQCEQ